MRLQPTTPTDPIHSRTTPDLAGGHPGPDVSYRETEDSQTPEAEPVPYSPDEEALVEERLRNLGYL